MSEVSGSGNNTSQEGQVAAATTDVNLEHAPASNTGDSNADASDVAANIPAVVQAPLSTPATGGPSSDLDRQIEKLHCCEYLKESKSRVCAQKPGKY